MSYGYRYLTASSFVSYCKSLNVEITEDELEYYQREGFMYPVARVILPEDLVKAQWGDDEVSESDPSWEEPLRLLNEIRPEQHTPIADLLPAFDKELEKGNPFIIRPAAHNYVPWNENKVIIKHSGQNLYSKPAMTHYYSYWQVYQVVEVKRLFIVRHEGRRQSNGKLVLVTVASYKKEHGSDNDRTFHGLQKFFDGLSLYIGLVNNERIQLDSLTISPSGRSIVTKVQFREYQQRCFALAQLTSIRHGLNQEDLLRFIAQLVERRSSYNNEEHIKLANALRSDIIYSSEWIAGLNSRYISWEDFSKQLSQHNAGYWTVQEFRHLDITLKVRDESERNLEHFVQRHKKELKGKRLGTKNVRPLLLFCEKNGLDLLLHTLADTHGKLDPEEERKFWGVTRYTTLKNLA